MFVGVVFLLCVQLVGCLRPNEVYILNLQGGLGSAALPQLFQHYVMLSFFIEIHFFLNVILRGDVFSIELV